MEFIKNGYPPLKSFAYLKILHQWGWDNQHLLAGDGHGRGWKHHMPGVHRQCSQAWQVQQVTGGVTSRYAYIKIQWSYIYSCKGSGIFFVP